MANKKVTKQPLVLSEDILIGKIGLSDTQHIDIYCVEDKPVGKNIETTEDIAELIGDVIIITAE